MNDWKELKTTTPTEISSSFVCDWFHSERMSPSIVSGMRISWYPKRFLLNLHPKFRVQIQQKIPPLFCWICTLFFCMVLGCKKSAEFFRVQIQHFPCEIVSLFFKHESSHKQQHSLQTHAPWTVWSRGKAATSASKEKSKERERD